mgnify:CR=1 FL=1
MVDLEGEEAASHVDLHDGILDEALFSVMGEIWIERERMPVVSMVDLTAARPAKTAPASRALGSPSGASPPPGTRLSSRRLRDLPLEDGHGWGGGDGHGWGGLGICKQ